jgi:hypothetical protein
LWFVYFHKKSENHIFGWFYMKLKEVGFISVTFEPFIYFYYISIDGISKLLGVRF